MNEEESKVNKLSDTLYSRTNYKAPQDERTRVSNEEVTDAPEDWKSPNFDEMLKTERRKPEQSSFMKKIFILAIVFFLSAIAVAGYIFLGGANFISSKNVDISVLGPVSISAGDVLELGITITNKNNADLESANLAIVYPQGTREADDDSKSLTYYREELGSIGAGAEKTVNAKSMIFGEIGEVKTVKVSVEYKVKGSNATFYKDKVYEISVGETPVSIKVTEPDSVTSGDTFTTTVTLTSDSSEPVKNIMVRGEYPYGYGVISSEPAATGENNVWSLGDIAPGEVKTIEIKGKVLAEDNEERTFRFYAGVADSDNNTDGFKTTLASVLSTVGISRPSLGLAVTLNGDDSSVYTAPSGRSLQSQISLKNNLPENLFNPRVEVTLNGTALDKQSVTSSDGGFYDSQSSKITWHPTGSDGQSQLSPGDITRVSFNLASLVSLSAGSSNRQINLNIKALGEDSAGKTISVSTTRTIRIASEVSLASRAVYTRGPFTNSGTIPPKAEKPTTYTVILDLKNTENDISGSKVTASLGQNVKWLDTKSPSMENLSYDESKNTVTWDVGTLPSGAGFSSPGREVAFKVELTPSISQIGSSPTLVYNIAFSGMDTFTKSAVSSSNNPVNTSISTDPSYVQGDGVVVK